MNKISKMTVLLAMSFIIAQESIASEPEKTKESAPKTSLPMLTLKGLGTGALGWISLGAAGATLENLFLALASPTTFRHLSETRGGAVFGMLFCGGVSYGAAYGALKLGLDAKKDFDNYQAENK